MNLESLLCKMMQICNPLTVCWVSSTLNYLSLGIKCQMDFSEVIWRMLCSAKLFILFLVYLQYVKGPVSVALLITKFYLIKDLVMVLTCIILAWRNFRLLRIFLDGQSFIQSPFKFYYFYTIQLKTKPYICVLRFMFVS